MAEVEGGDKGGGGAEGEEAESTQPHPHPCPHLHNKQLKKNQLLLEALITKALAAMIVFILTGSPLMIQ